jgi:N-acetylglucosaminyldiphosphoundecaprenol N-acetyl-beta-D-mannosaminyltransferase
MLESPKTFSVMKLPVHLLADYTRWLIQRLHEGRGTHVVTLNAEMAMLAEQNPDVAKIIKEADLVVPDGAGVVIYLRMRGRKQQRCPGIELAESLLKELGPFGKSYPIVFYGGKPGIAEEAAQKWRQKIPEISITTNHGYLSTTEAETWQETLRSIQPKLIFVGLGVPRQEFWIRENQYLCPDGIWIGVGGSFDIWSGIKTRAPAWFCDRNLEWLYRLYQEPWRWKRMTALPKFFWRALIENR